MALAVALPESTRRQRGTKGNGLATMPSRLRASSAVSGSRGGWTRRAVLGRRLFRRHSASAPSIPIREGARRRGRRVSHVAPARHGWTHRRLRVYPKRDSGASMALPKGGERGEGMADAKSFPEVPVEKLRWRCDPGAFQFQTTEELSCSESIIGQDRAKIGR